jgi:RNA polymerase sigma factor (sigma-70 family)
LSEVRLSTIGGDGNPLHSDDPRVWDRLIETVGPASILVVIESRMSAALRNRITPEDIWQETLLHAWRDRLNFEWRGVKSFRSWLLTIADRRIRDAAQYERAQKRGGGITTSPFSTLRNRRTEDSPPDFPGPAGSTTPSKVAMHGEQAAAMRVALESLADDVRDVVRLRLFEQITVEQIAERLGISPPAVRHRFRKGAQAYRRRLMAELSTRSVTISSESMNAFAENSSPAQ